MEITKKELITLLREDMREQHAETPEHSTLIRINNIALYDNRTLKFCFSEHYVSIFRVHNKIKLPIAHVWYSDINSVGYKYNSMERVEHRIAELRDATLTK